MLVLGIDTATRTGAVGLLDGAKVIFTEQTIIRPGGSEKLPALLDAALKAAAVSPEDLELIAVGVGPGSYTGVRVGLAIAKGLALGLGLPLVGVSTLQALAVNLPPSGQLVCPLVKSRKGEVYAGIYRRTAENLVELAPPASWKWEELALKLKAREESIIFLGEHDEYQTYLATFLKGQALFGVEQENLVEGTAIARLGLAEWEKNKENQLYTALPLYLKRTEAEVRWEERGCPG